MRLRALLASLALLAAAASAAASSAAAPPSGLASPPIAAAPLGDPVPCQWAAPDGAKFDFSELKTATGVQATGQNDDVFSINVCGVSQADGPQGTCASQQAMVCMQYTWASAWYAIAKNDNSGNPTYSLADSTKGSAGGVKLTLKNGAYGPTPATVDITFLCGSGTDSYAAHQDASDRTHWLVSVTSSKACAKSSGGGGGGGKHGLSGGWAFIIFIVCATTVYVAGGCLFKRHRQGTQGVESCPNIDFWRELPALVKDGCRFTWAKLRGCMGGAKGSETYQEFK